ncbi:MAG TPA: hypothetical protein VGE98_12355 [Thermoanaerobaculia bacterium]
MSDLPTDTDLPSATKHASPPLALLAIVYTVLFLAGLYPVTVFGGQPHFPGPWEPADALVAFFRSRPNAVLACAFLQFGAAIPLGLFVATSVSRLHFLGVRAAGATIALFGGLATAFDMLATASVLWVMAIPGLAADGAVVRALYYLAFVLGGPGFSVPLGLFLAGVSITAAFYRLLPKWIVVLGLVLATAGELSWFSLVVPGALFLIPLTRFPSFVWLIAAGVALPTSAAAARARQVPAVAAR